MISIKIKNNKAFMGELFAGKCFDGFYITNCLIKTFSVITISGKRNYEWYEGEKESLKEYCSWMEIKEMVYNVIKGKKTPDLINITFVEECANEACNTGVLNLKYENDDIYIVVGYNYATFSMDKTDEKQWEKEVVTLLEDKSIDFEIC